MKQTYDLNYYLEDVLQHNDDLIKPLTFNERIEKLRILIFNFDYGIDAQYKEAFEKGFVSHFLFKEIGFSTFTRWHFELQAHLNVHGARYNNLYQAEIKDINDAINTIKIENISQADSIQQNNVSGMGTNTSESENFTNNRASDTPQGRTEIDGNYISGMSDAKQISTNMGGSTEENEQNTKAKNKGKSSTIGYSGLTLTQLNRIFAEQMIVANEIIFYNFEKLFNQIVI